MPFDQQSYDEALARFAAIEGDPQSLAKLSIRDILRAAEEATGVPAGDLTGPTRIALVVTIRDEVCLLAHEHGYSLKQIGRALGGRDHSTVASAIKRARFRQARNHVAARAALMGER